MTCPTCAGGLPLDVPSCPDCGAPNRLYDRPDSTRSDWPQTLDVTQPAGPRASEAAGGPDILGFVVLYAESAEPAVAAPAGAVPPPSLGRAYPLRKGDVFFVGKAPLPNEIPAPDGRKLVPTAWHLFPFTEDYAHISRRHLVIEMAAPGAATLIDLSTNGLYLLGEGRHVRRGRGETAQVHTLTGNETVVLGVDLKAADRTAREKAWRYQVQIVPLQDDGQRSLLTTTVARGGKRRASRDGAR